jgi:hypothetical protein
MSAPPSYQQAMGYSKSMAELQLEVNKHIRQLVAQISVRERSISDLEKENRLLKEENAKLSQLVSSWINLANLWSNIAERVRN